MHVTEIYFQTRVSEIFMAFQYCLRKYVNYFFFIILTNLKEERTKKTETIVKHHPSVTAGYGFQNPPWISEFVDAQDPL